MTGWQGVANGVEQFYDICDTRRAHKRHNPSQSVTSMHADQNSYPRSWLIVHSPAYAVRIGNLVLLMGR